MADMSFDIVIVGAGNKGLIAAMYLTKYGGMSVGLFEERHEIGSGWCSEESPAPGFMANHCSHLHPDTEVYHKPVYEDFPEWIEYGVKYTPHLLNMGVVFVEDDTYIGYYHLDEDPDGAKTAEIISRFSRKDADKWMWLMDKMVKYIRPAMIEWLFTPAQPLGVKDAFDRLVENPESGIDPNWLFMSAAQVYRDLFESLEAQNLLARGLQSAGIPPDAYGMGIGVLPWLANFLKSGAMPGGNHTIPHACQRVILENGGKIFHRKKVDKIIIENGKAKGIRLSDGVEIEAKKAVLSNVDPYQLLFELTGKEHFSDQIIRKVANLETDWTTISWYTWALHERPNYKCKNFFPDVGRTPWLCLATKSLDDLVEEAYRRRLMMWPDPEKLQLIVSDHSIVEPTYSVEGKCAILTEQYVLPAHAYSDEKWKEVEKRHADEIVRHWQKYAPNMTWDNVIGHNMVTPYFTSLHARNWGRSGNWNVIDLVPSQFGRMRPIPEWAAGRIVPIKGLYGTGAGWHPYGGGHSFQGYNSYKIMAEDFGLRKPWEEKGRPY